MTNFLTMSPGSLSPSCCRSHRQLGVVLFIALIGMLTIMLAAVALIRSVDTNTVIANNLSSKQAATSAADAGTELVVAWLLLPANAVDGTIDPYTVSTHVLNSNNTAVGYYSWIQAGLDRRADSTWVDGVSSTATTDANGNTVRYLIERMCNVAGQPPTANCVFAPTGDDGDSRKPGEQLVQRAGRRTVYRVTVKVVDARNTVSFIQGFIS